MKFNVKIRRGAAVRQSTDAIIAKPKSCDALAPPRCGVGAPSPRVSQSHASIHSKYVFFAIQNAFQYTGYGFSLCLELPKWDSSGGHTQKHSDRRFP